MHSGIIPNSVAVPQSMETNFLVVNGTQTGRIFQSKPYGIPKIIHVGFHCIAVDGGANGGKLQMKLQRSIDGGAFEDVSGQVACSTVYPGEKRKWSFNFYCPYYDGISPDVSTTYRVVGKKINVGDTIILHTYGAPENAIPAVTWKSQLFFDGEGGEPPVIPPTIILNPSANYANIQPVTWPFKPVFTQKSLVMLSDGRGVSFFQDDNSTTNYETLVWSFDGETLTPGSTQQFSSPNSPDFSNSVFIHTGGNRVVGSFQNYGVVYSYLADSGGGLSLTEIDIGGTYPIPDLHEDLFNCSRAAVTYVPATNKVIFLTQSTYEMETYPHTRSSTHLATGQFSNHAISNYLWDGSVEYINIEGAIAAGAVGSNGDFVIAARLYNTGGGTSRIAFIRQNVSSDGTLSTHSDTNFPIDSYGRTWDRPSAIIGDPSNSRFVILMSSDTSIFAMLCTLNGSGGVDFSTPLEIADTGGSLESDYGSGAWIPNTDYFIIQFSNNSYDLVYKLLKITSGVLSVEDTETFPAESSGAIYGQLLYSPAHDYFMSAYDINRTASLNNNRRLRSVKYKDA